MSLLSAISAPRARKIVLVAVSASMIGAGIGAPTSASAFHLPCWKFGTCKPGPKSFPGYGAAAIAGGFALGAIAASAANADSEDCAIERRRAFDEDGNIYYRRVRVCE
ncbi:hypothetical protein HCU64_01265 [Methylobacterium sp. C25]|uniref:hypothetical protein n=1 Tax=Methylobacterium sp. C25 TaxID=2721622 RepID=UPI001F3BD49C|nr:hypothetical protein [Methylobacterium sp. C25]MCE4222368.1 hypothetical protein [Methylobacterium sp. C25]